MGFWVKFVLFLVQKMLSICPGSVLPVVSYAKNVLTVRKLHKYTLFESGFDKNFDASEIDNY